VDVLGVLVGLGEQLDLGDDLLVNEFDVTKLGCPVALPRFINRPSANG